MAGAENSLEPCASARSAVGRANPSRDAIRAIGPNPRGPWVSNPGTNGDEPMRGRRLAGWITLIAVLACPAALEAEEPKPDWDALVRDLTAEDGRVRLRATKALFEQGRKAIAPLERAGAVRITPFGTIRTRRIDMVAALLRGLEPTPKDAKAGYARNSFGLHVEPGVTRRDVVAMGRRHGFEIDKRFDANDRPACYVRLSKGKVLEDVLRSVLTDERKIVSVSMNYYES